MWAKPVVDKVTQTLPVGPQLFAREQQNVEGQYLWILLLPLRREVCLIIRAVVIDRQSSQVNTFGTFMWKSNVIKALVYLSY